MMSKLESHEIHGNSHYIKALRAQIKNLKDESIPNILIIGPKGTGKERIARSLNASNQSRPFVYVDCASLPKANLDGLFFGYAPPPPHVILPPSISQVGLIEMAEGGDLYLDRICKLSLTAQKKLMRFFSNREYSKLGDHTTRLANVRVIASTQEDLKEKSRHNFFLKELYSQFSFQVIQTSPLSQRKSDIPLLITDLLERLFSNEIKISKDLLTHLLSLPWSENIDELKKTILDSHINAKKRGSKVLDIEDLSNKQLTTDLCHLLPNSKGEISKVHLSEYLEASEKLYWIKVFSIFNGNATRLSQETSIPLSTINYKIKQFKLRKLSLVRDN